MMFEIIQHNALKPFPIENKVQCVVTSPPYWQQRDYKDDNQIGNEKNPEKYIENLTTVFKNVYTVLKEDGLLWIIIGDKYFNEQLLGLPWKLMEALKKIGFIVRAENIWYKPNCLPESVKNRTTRAHEFIFMLSKNRRYYYDIDAIREPHTARIKGGAKRLKNGIPGQTKHTFEKNYHPKGRNKRTIWEVGIGQNHELWHYAVYPPNLILPCILASTQKNDWVLDPFSGSATTGSVTLHLDRNYYGLEINDVYVMKSQERLKREMPIWMRN